MAKDLPLACGSGGAVTPSLVGVSGRDGLDVAISGGRTGETTVPNSVLRLESGCGLDFTSQVTTAINGAARVALIMSVEVCLPERLFAQAIKGRPTTRPLFRAAAAATKAESGQVR